MKTAIARAVMTLAVGCMAESRREWSLAMRAEFEAAVTDGKPLVFAIGCLAAAGREMVTREEGRFVLTSYALALGLMIPMAALQIGCAVLGLPYLYPGQKGLGGALLNGGAQEVLLRGVYQAAVPSLSILLVLLGVGQLGIAWAVLERDWARVRRTGMRTLAAAATLIVFMATLFLDGSQAMLQAGILAIELAILSVVVRWHAELFPSALAEEPHR